MSAYLNENKIENSWLDIRDVLQTDNNYREAKVNYDLTGKLIAERIPALFEKKNFIITQGFIGATSENFRMMQ